MTYQIILRPVNSNRAPAVSVVDTDGTVYQSLMGTFISSTQASSLVSSGTGSKVALAAIGNTVQPSAAQLAALLVYLAAIQAGTNTATVETAINAL